MLEISAPLRSTAIKTTLLMRARDTAIGVPIMPPAREVNTASRTPIPPGTPTTTKPASHEVVVMKSMSNMPMWAPKAVAVTDVDNDISNHAGICSTVRRTNRFGSVSDDAEDEIRDATRIIAARRDGCEKVIYAAKSPIAIKIAMSRCPVVAAAPIPIVTTAAAYVVISDKPVEAYASIRGMPFRTASSARPTIGQIPPGTYFPNWPVKYHDIALR